jgi:methyl-accepting chemotaxis protein
MLTHLRIHWKLALLSLTFMVPITLLASLYIKKSYKDIAFAQKEIAGAYYIDVLRNMAFLVASDDLTAASAQLSVLEDINSQSGSEMDLNDIPAKLTEAIRRTVSGAGGQVRLEIVDTVLELIGRIGDGSNLILDPDLDSYYSMDIVVVKMPLAMQQAIIAFDAAHRVIGSEKPSSAEIAALQVAFAQLRGTLNGINLSLASAFRGNADKRLQHKLDASFGSLRATATVYVSALQAISKACEQGNPVFSQADPDLSRLKTDFVVQLKSSWELTSTELVRLLRERIQAFSNELYWSLAISVLIVFPAIILALFITRSISKPVSELVLVMKAMSQGDMTVPVHGVMRRDEAGMMARAAQEMQDQLHGLASNIDNLAGQVYKAAQDINDSVTGQAAASSQMSASVAEITTTVEELSASSTVIAQHSQSVVEIATLTYESSVKGQQAMSEVSDKTTEIQEDNQQSSSEIHELSHCSREISKVMEIINTVADQTKLIAFNAALEAAGAGDSGRRFGVVASEIRRLADSVTESTGEIEERINQIQAVINRLAMVSEKGSRTITAGKLSTCHAQDSLAELVAATHQTSSAAQQISLATQQQKTASAQVAIALREIMTASAQTAHSISCISEISKDTARLATELEQALTQFKLRSSE